MTTNGSAPSSRVRDPRLDFYRGIAMFIIYISHTPGNWWGQWIPGRFGFSDATEIFVFCSGMASAIAFGGSYDRRGWTLGTARVGYRVWQIYWAHIALFFATAMMLAAIDQTGLYDKVYIGTLNLWKFFENTQPQLVGLFTLTYVPNFFDILPMYMVLLLLMPFVMALSRVNLWLVALMIGGLWFFAQNRVLTELGIGHLALNLPAEPWSERSWFFNPFAWQLVFFTGFAFMRGWLPKPPVNVWLILGALAIVIGFVFLSVVAVREFRIEGLAAWRTENRIWTTKTDFGVLRYIHFLALAYLAWIVAGEGGHRLIITGQGAVANIGRRIVALITKVGQQSLAVFMVSIVLSRFAGFILDQTGNSYGPTAFVNIAGCAILVLTAYLVAWFKGQPWRGSATG